MLARALALLFGSRRRAGVVVAAWIVVVAILAAVAPSLDAVKDDVGGNDPAPSAQSMRAADLAAAQFSDADGTPALIVIDDADEPAADAAARITDAIDAADLDAVAHVGPGAPAGSDGAESTEMLIAVITGEPTDTAFQDTVTDLREVVAEASGSATVSVTGPAGIATDTVEVFRSGGTTLLLATIGLVVVLLLVIYRSPLLVVAALAGVGVAMRLTETVGALMADAGWFTISSQTSSIMTVLLFGVGTDYALIVIARYREAIAETDDLPAAMRSAMRGVTGAIVSSVSTIVLAMMALLLAVSPALSGFGPYLALGVASMGAVAFTFVPAVMLLFGRALFWPASVEKTAARGTGRIWNRVADTVARRPAAVLAGGLAVLVVLTAGLTGYKESYDFISGFRAETQSETGRDMIAAAYGPGEIAPATLYVHADGADPGATWSAAAEAADLDGVVRVGTPRPGDDGQTAAIEIVFADDPYGPGALDRVGEMRTAVASATGLDTDRVLVGGPTAEAADTRADLGRDTAVVAVAVLLIVAAVLGLLLRSILAPLYLVGTLVLSVTATLGLTTFLTVTVGGDAGIGNRVAVYVLVFLVALGVDYTIFLLSRYRQELVSTPPATALRTSLVRTGGVISSAGLILAGTFAVLTTQPIRELHQFGLAMAIGILLDTFVVRPLVVPAIVRMLGDRALWPSRPPHPQHETTDADDVPAKEA